MDGWKGQRCIGADSKEGRKPLFFVNYRDKADLPLKYFQIIINTLNPDASPSL